MCNQNISSNKFDLNLSTTLSSYYKWAYKLVIVTAWPFQPIVRFASKLNIQLTKQPSLQKSMSKFTEKKFYDIESSSISLVVAHS